MSVELVHKQANTVVMKKSNFSPFKDTFDQNRILDCSFNLPKMNFFEIVTEKEFET